MKWEKRGLIVAPDPTVNWMCKYAMMPTPFYEPGNNTIRIYFGTTTQDNYGTSTYVDVDANDPSRVLFIEKSKPILDLGRDGTFDDAGAISSSVLKVKDKCFLYYVGFQRTQKVPFMLFPGLAFSNDGENFRRYSEAPIIDRNQHHFFSFAAPFVLAENGIFKMWLWIGKEWVTVKNKKYLSASIGYAESKDGVDWSIQNESCILPKQPDEFSLGRPWVIKEGELYRMFYSIRFVEKLYRLGYAESYDGIHWVRKDDEVGIDISKTGWDSEMICYPSVIKVKDRTYLFYNGNNNGETGFGWAELVAE